MTGAYYSNPRNRLPNDRIAAEYWRDSLVQVLPYNRGLIYFVNLDAKIRATSKGNARWTIWFLRCSTADAKARATTKQTGDVGLVRTRRCLRPDFDAMLRGELIIPPRNGSAFCLERQTRTITQRWLGFADRSLLNEPLTVVGSRYGERRRSRRFARR